MTNTQITPHIAVNVIASEKHPLRFEEFCNRLISLAEGDVPIYSTSSTRDLGRDGRGPHASGLFVCASLDKSVSQKALSDVIRLAENARSISRVYFCSARELTEEVVESIKSMLIDNLPQDVAVEVLGGKQLAQLAARFPEAYFTHYRKETEEFLGALSGIRSASTSNSALELALATIGNPSSRSIREQVYRDVLRTVLSSTSRNTSECASAVSQALRLSRVISTEAVAAHLRQLVSIGEVEAAEGRFSLTDVGRLRLREQQNVSEEKLLVGRRVVRERIEAELGYLLADDQYARIWNVIQEDIVNFFYLRGLSFVTMMSKLLQGDSLPEDQSIRQFAHNLARSVAANSGLPQQREELRVAIIDLFEQPVGPAAEWLVGLCSGYVVLCSLGLENESGTIVAETLRRMRLVLDADIVLSLLSEGEPNHEAVVDIVDRWVRLGGKVMVADEVLHEVAYHAQIAQLDFDNVREWLPGTEESRLTLIENAFVRGFAHLMAIRGVKIGRWRDYIEQFRAAGVRGISRVASVLLEEHQVERVPSDLPGDPKLERDVTEFLMSTYSTTEAGPGLKKRRDRAERDASLYQKLVALIDRAEAGEPGVSYFLISSSRRLAKVEQRFRAVDEENFIVSVSGMLYLLTLVPEVSMGIGSMRAFLFEGAKVAFSGGIERLILRVIQESQEFELSPARRGALMRQFRSRLVDFAVEAGVDSEDLEREIERGERSDLTVSLLRGALDDVAVDVKIRRENQALREELALLRREMMELRRARRGG